jgi:transposase
VEQQVQTPKRARRKYTAEFKQSAVDLVLNEGYSLAEASRRLGVAENNIFNWKQQLAKARALKTQGSAEAIMAENRRLKERTRRLELECEILKKAATYFATQSAPDLALSPNTSRSMR